jgi:ferredoxin-type protein NapH
MAAIFVLKPELDIRLKKMRYYFLTIWLVIICIGIFVTDPWCALYGNEIDYSSLIGLFAVLASALIVSMAWCRYLCPLGTFLSLTTRFSQTRIKRNKSVVSGDTVREICYVQALGEKSLDENSCLFCKRCVEAKVSEVEEL